MKQPDDPLRIVKKKLDGLKDELNTAQRLRNGGFLDDKLEKRISDNEGLYGHNLEHLRRLKAYDDLKAYAEWYKKYLNVGDPL